MTPNLQPLSDQGPAARTHAREPSLLRSAQGWLYSRAVPREGVKEMFAITAGPDISGQAEPHAFL